MAVVIESYHDAKSKITTARSTLSPAGLYLDSFVIIRCTSFVEGLGFGKGNDLLSNPSSLFSGDHLDQSNHLDTEIGVLKFA